MLVATPKKRHSQIHRANLIGVINSAGKYAMRSYYSNFSNWHQKGMHISLNFPSRQDIPPTENGKAIVLYPFIHTCIISIQEGAALSHQGSLIAVVSETMYVRLTPPALWTCLMCGSPPPPAAFGRCRLPKTKEPVLECFNKLAEATKYWAGRLSFSRGRKWRSSFTSPLL